MSKEKFVDPRLQAKESIFQHLHLSTFDTMAYAHAVIQEVNSSGRDISNNNETFQQLLRDYEITKNVSKTIDSPLETLCSKTSEYLNVSNKPNASLAQLAAAATNALNHWRILNEIPEDLIDVDEVTSKLKGNYKQHLMAWKQMLSEF